MQLECASVKQVLYQPRTQGLLRLREELQAAAKDPGWSWSRVPPDFGGIQIIASFKH